MHQFVKVVCAAVNWKRLSQVRNVGQSVVEERSAHDHDVLLLREDLVVTKQNLAETQKRENQVGFILNMHTEAVRTREWLLYFHIFFEIDASRITCIVAINLTPAPKRTFSPNKKNENARCCNKKGVLLKPCSYRKK